MAQDMRNFVLLEGYKNDMKAKHEKRVLDAQASYTSMEQCLKVLEMNSMPELSNIKAMMRRAMKDMVEIGNGKKTSKG